MFQGKEKIVPDKLSFGKTFLALENALTVSQQRHNQITSNISNIETPDYRAKEVDFKAAMAKTLESGQGVELVRTHEGHIDIGMNFPGRVEPFEEQGEWNGFNWVSIEREMTKLTENNLIYRTAAENLLRKIRLMKEVIREGGK